MRKNIRSVQIIAAFLSVIVSQSMGQVTVGHITLNGDNTDILGSAFPVTTPFFYWLPARHAFRFGYFKSAYEVTQNTIGYNSFAGLDEAVASGAGSLALGGVASAANSISLRGNVTSSGNNGFATTGGNVIGSNGVAIGTGGITGWGYNGDGSIIPYLEELTFGSYASGKRSFAAAGGAATGYNSFAVGPTSAVGYHSASFGLYTTAPAQGSFAVGVGNLGTKKDGSTPAAGSQDGHDPIFEVGNGSINHDPDRGWELIAPHNALTVYRDGTVHISKASGGISMGVFQ